MYKLLVTYSQQGKMSVEKSSIDECKQTLEKFVGALMIATYLAIITDSEDKEVWLRNKDC